MILDSNTQNTSVAEDDDDILVFEDDDLIMFDDEGLEGDRDRTSESSIAAMPWKVTIVDDDRAVHQATQLALKNFQFDGRPLQLFHALSGAEAQLIIRQNPDMAFILLDVVMETNDAGLRVVRYIRDDLRNKEVQIVLRTGQPGEAPEESVIRHYEINDYKLKVELTRQRLITTTIAALRSYRNTLALAEKTTELSATLESLQKTQLQLVQSEKMSALGSLVAGIAHEINNPVGFLQGNIRPAKDYVRDLLDLIDLLLEKCPQDAEVQVEIDAIDLEFVRDDLPQILDSMTVGIDRIRGITNSLRTFSRQDRDYKVRFNVDEGIESTLLILKHCTKANDRRPEIQILRNYSEITEIECFPGQLNQVFMNILSNAIDAFDRVNEGKSYAQIEAKPNQILIETFLVEERLQIRFSDNGCGMPRQIQERIFEQGFTTKGVGKGTGLGMAIAYEIVTEKHGGSLKCQSQLGIGTTFILDLPIKSPPLAETELALN